MKQLYEFSKEQKEIITLKIKEFYNFILEQSNNSFVGFKGNLYLDYYENYKYKAIRETRSIISEIRILTNYGQGKILEKLIDGIKVGYNLVNSFWRDNVKSCLTDLKGDELKTFEKKYMNCI